MRPEKGMRPVKTRSSGGPGRGRPVHEPIGIHGQEKREKTKTRRGEGLERPRCARVQVPAYLRLPSVPGRDTMWTFAGGPHGLSVVGMDSLLYPYGTSASVTLSSRGT